MDRNQQVGRSGEKKFSDWMTDVGITCNKSGEDEHGWDFVIEFEAPLAKEIPADLKMNHFTAFVQVKTTQNDLKSIPMKLSNWNFLCKKPSPVFIVSIQLNTELKVQKVWLTHIGEELIFKTLKKLRENEGSGKKLHEISMHFFPNSDEEINPPHGDRLRHRLYDFVGDNTAEYINWKMHLLKTVGYSSVEAADMGGVLSSDATDLVDFAVGLKSQIPVKNITINQDIRFGIPGKTEAFTEGFIEFQPQGEVVELVLKKKESELKLMAELFTSAKMFPGIPSEKAKAVIKTKVIDFILSGNGSLQGSLKVELLKEKAGLKQMNEMASCLTMLLDKEYDLQLEIKRGEEIMKLSSICFNLPADKTSEKQIIQYAQLIQNLTYIAEYFSLDITQKTHITDSSANRRIAEEVRTFLDTHRHSVVKMKFDFHESFPQGCTLAVPRVFNLLLLGKRIVIQGAYINRFDQNELIGEQFPIETYVKVDDVIAMDIDSDFDYAKLKDELVKKYQKRHVVFIV